MQRLATHGARVATPVGIGVGVAIASGANTSTAHCRAPQEHERELQPTSPKRTLSLSDGEDWQFVLGPAAKPVEPTEVSAALHDLCAMTEVMQPRVSLPRSLSDSDIIPVIGRDDDTDDDSPSSSVNEILAMAERPFAYTAGAASEQVRFGQRDRAEHPADTVAEIVSNLLNDPHLGPAICQHVCQDAAFRRALDEYVPQRIAGPAAQRPLLLPAPSRIPHKPKAGPAVALDILLDGIYGVLENIVKAVCAFGGSLRCLPGDLRLLLSHLSHRERQVSTTPVQADAEREQFRAALLRVATTVAVAVLARRMILFRRL